MVAVTDQLAGTGRSMSSPNSGYSLDFLLACTEMLQTWCCSTRVTIVVASCLIGRGGNHQGTTNTAAIDCQARPFAQQTDRSITANSRGRVGNLFGQVAVHPSPAI